MEALLVFIKDSDGLLGKVKGTFRTIFIGRAEGEGNVSLFQDRRKAVDLLLGIAGEKVDADKDRKAVLAGVVDMEEKVWYALFKTRAIRLVQILEGLSAMEL